MSTPVNKPVFIGFDASLREHAGRSFGVAFLNMITLGIYKPYGFTLIRHYLYTHTFIKGIPLDYHGDAKSLSRVTFYPSLVFLFLLLVPGILQFFIPWTGIIVIGILQALLLMIYSHFLIFQNKRYELSNLSWNSHPVTLCGDSLTYAKKSLFSLALTALTFGLATPWRRVMLSNEIYDNLFIGAQRVESPMSSRPLWLAYTIGWALALAGFIYAGWYYWENGIQPVMTIYNGGHADLAMADGVDASSLGGGIGGPVSKETLAEIGTFINAISLPFVVYPLWVIWKKLCLCLYEARFKQHWAQSTQCCDAHLCFTGTPQGIFFRDSLCFLMNFFSGNLTRPFTTYIRLRYTCHTLIIQNADKLLSTLTPKPPAPHHTPPEPEPQSQNS